MIGMWLTRRREAAGDRWLLAVDRARLLGTCAALDAADRARRRLWLADALLDAYRWAWTTAAGVR